MDFSPPGSSVHGISQARIVEYVAISSPGDLSDPGIEPRSPAWQAEFFTTEPPGKPIGFSAAAKSLQSCPTLCDTIDGSPPGSSVPGILQARTLEWVAISFSNACMHSKWLQSCPTLCDPMDSSPPGSSVHTILQARILEWVAISFSADMQMTSPLWQKAKTN